MKKTLLTICICLVVMLGSFSAQAIGADTGASAADAVDHSIGSIHGFKVNFDGSNIHMVDHKDNFYIWKVFTVDGATVTELTDYSKFQFVSYDPTGTDMASKFGGNIGTNGVYSSQNAYGVGVQWLDVLAAGVYAVEVQEYNGADATFCSARRRFYVSVTSGELDFTLAARKANNGDEISGSATQELLTTCNSFSGGLIENDGSTDLGTSVFYYKINMSTDAQEWNGQWGFDYTFAELNSPVYEVKIVDAIGSSTDVGNATGGNAIVNVNNPTAYVKVIVTNALGTPASKDYTMKMIVTSETPFIRTVVDDVTSEQTELAAQNTNNNEALSFIINASPEVGAIGVD